MEVIKDKSNIEKFIDIDRCNRMGKHKDNLLAQSYLN